MKMVAKLLVLLSLLLSPLAMQPAMASAHPSASSAMAGHGHHGEKPKQSVPGECAMGCASALPAFDIPTLGESDWAPTVAEPAPIHALSGLSPESDTPPPRSI